MLREIGIDLYLRFLHNLYDDLCNTVKFQFYII
jgi:hypothetical protein